MICQMTEANQLNPSFTDKKKLRLLRPIRTAYGFYNRDGIEWEDPRNKKVYKESFKFLRGNTIDEYSRLKAIDNINAKITEYNEFCEDETAKLGIDKIEQQKFYSQSLFWKWGLNIQLETRTFKPSEQPQMGDWSDGDILGIRNINNEFVYKNAFYLSREFFVPRFNKTIYEFLKLIVGKNKLHHDSTFYYPMLEFEDWFMAKGLDKNKVSSLKHKNMADGWVKSKSATTGSNVLNKTLSDDELIINQLKVAQDKVKELKQKNKGLKFPAEGRILKLIEQGQLDTTVDQLRHKSSGLINWTALCKILKCTDKKAKDLVITHASYLMAEDDAEVTYRYLKKGD